MPKNREKTRANKKKESMLSKINEYGMSDPTPYIAIRELINADK